MRVIRTIVTVAALAFVLVDQCNAATISWSSKPYVNTGSKKEFMGTGQFDKSGMLVYAENCNGVATNFDGIAFEANSGVFVSGRNWSGTNFHNGIINNPISDTGTAYWPGGLGPETILLGDGGTSYIAVGRKYRIQLFVMDGRVTNRRYEVDGIDQGTYTGGDNGANTWGDGMLVTGNFTADDTNQSFTVESFTGLTALGAQLNALLLHDLSVLWTSQVYTNTGSKKEFTGTGQFDQSLRLHYAENVGGVATNFDGIDFEADSGIFPATFNGYHYNSVTNPVSATGGWAVSPVMVTIGAGGAGPDLTPGTRYQIQLLFMDGRDGYNGRGAKVDGSYQGSYANGDDGVTTYGDGLLVTTTIIAESTSFTFNIGATLDGYQLNALLVHTPATSTVIMLK